MGNNLTQPQKQTLNQNPLVLGEEKHLINSNRELFNQKRNTLTETISQSNHIQMAMGYFTSRKTQHEASPSRAPNSQQSQTTMMHLITVYYNDTQYVKVKFGMQKEEDQEELTSGWLLSEVIRNLHSLSHSPTQDDRLVPISLSTLDQQSECIDYYLMKMSEPLGNFLTFTSSKNENCQIAEQQLKVNYVTKEELQIQTESDKKKMKSLPCLHDFDLLKVLGTGGFSQVLMVRKRTTGMLYAMKVINKKNIVDSDKVHQIINERKILSMLDHPFIVQLHWAFTSKNYLFLVLDLCPGGELFYYITKQKRFNEVQAKLYFAEVVLALEFLHKSNIIYRDLKPENILIDEKGHIKLTDFGLSKLDFGQYDQSYSFCGSPEYMSPEMLNNSGHGRQLDIYCLGVLLFELLTALPPHYDDDRIQMYQDISQKQVKFPKYLSETVIDLLRKMLEKDPNKRIGSQKGIQEIKEHPFCKGIDWNKVYDKMELPPIKVNIQQSNFDAEFSNMKIELNTEREEDTPINLGEELNTEIAEQIKRIRSHSNLPTQNDENDFTSQNQITYYKKFYDKIMTTKERTIKIEKKDSNDQNFTSQISLSQQILVTKESTQETPYILQQHVIKAETPTFKEFLYRKNSKEFRDDDIIEVIRQDSALGGLTDQYNQQYGRTLPSILSENIDMLKANMQNMQTFEIKGNNIQEYKQQEKNCYTSLLRDKTDFFHLKIEESKIEEQSNELLKLVESEGASSSNAGSLASLNINKIEDYRASVLVNRHSFGSAGRSPISQANLNKLILEDFIWHKDHNSKTDKNIKLYQMKQFQSFKVKSKKSNNKVIFNMNELATFVNQNQAQTIENTKRFSNNLLTFTEKANGIISERKRQSKMTLRENIGEEAIAEIPLMLERQFSYNGEQYNKYEKADKALKLQISIQKQEPQQLHQQLDDCRIDFNVNKGPSNEDDEILSPKQCQKKTNQAKAATVNNTHKKQRESQGTRSRKNAASTSSNKSYFSSTQLTNYIQNTKNTSTIKVEEKSYNLKKSQKTAVRQHVEKVVCPGEPIQIVQEKLSLKNVKGKKSGKTRNVDIYAKNRLSDVIELDASGNSYPLFQTMKSFNQVQKTSQADQETIQNMFRTLDNRVSEKAIIEQRKGISPFFQQSKLSMKQPILKASVSLTKTAQQLQQQPMPKPKQHSHLAYANSKMIRQKSPQPKALGDIMMVTKNILLQSDTKNRVSDIGLSAMVSPKTKMNSPVYQKMPAVSQKVKESQIKKMISDTATTNTTKWQQKPAAQGTKANNCKNIQAKNLLKLPENCKQTITDTIDVSFVKDESIGYSKQKNNYYLMHTERSEICESSITEFDVEIFESIHNFKSSLKIHNNQSVQDFNAKECALSMQERYDEKNSEQMNRTERDNHNVELNTTGEYQSNVSSAQKNKERSIGSKKKNKMYLFQARRNTTQKQNNVGPIITQRLDKALQQRHTGRLLSPPIEASKTPSSIYEDEIIIKNEMSFQKKKNSVNAALNQSFLNRKLSYTIAAANSQQQEGNMRQINTTRQPSTKKNSQVKPHKDLLKIKDAIIRTQRANGVDIGRLFERDKFSQKTK